MKLLCVLLVGLATACAWAGLKTENSLQLQVNPGQALRLELSSGDYRIEPGANDQILVISRKSSIQPDEKPHFGVDSNAQEACVKVNAPQNYSAVIQVPRNSTLTENYARVDASVNVGHIQASPFGASEEGFVRSFSREGPGRYHLHAHVDSGDITMF